MVQLPEIQNADLVSRSGALQQDRLEAMRRFKHKKTKANERLRCHALLLVTEDYSLQQVERASDLCHQAIKVYLTAQKLSPRWLASIVQPYINLGRIHAARGECAASVEVFEGLMRLIQEQEPVVIDGFVVGRSELAHILDAEQSIQNVIINVYVSDSIKAFLISKDYEGLFTFLDRIEGAPWLDNSPYRYSIAREARARAWLGIGEYNKALKVLDDLNRKLNRQGTTQLRKAPGPPGDSSQAGIAGAMG